MSFITGFAAGVLTTIIVAAALTYVFKDYVVGYLIQYGQKQMQQQMLGGNGLKDMVSEISNEMNGGENT